MSPLLEIERIGSVVEQPERPVGVIGKFPDEDGTYELVNGEQVKVEMNPPEVEKGRKVIALTSNFFEGHVRSDGYVGPRRIKVYLNKQDEGDRQLSNYEVLKVSPYKPSDTDE